MHTLILLFPKVNNPKRPAPAHIEYKECLIACKLLPLTYRREIYDIVFFMKSIKGLLYFNILNLIQFIHDPIHRITRNRAHGLNLTVPVTKLEATAHFYPSCTCIAKLWNSLPIALRQQLITLISLYHARD